MVVLKYLDLEPIQNETLSSYIVNVNNNKILYLVKNDIDNKMNINYLLEQIKYELEHIGVLAEQTKQEIVNHNISLILLSLDSNYVMKLLNSLDTNNKLDSIIKIRLFTDENCFKALLTKTKKEDILGYIKKLSEENETDIYIKTKLLTGNAYFKIISKHFDENQIIDLIIYLDNNKTQLNTIIKENIMTDENKIQMLLRKLNSSKFTLLVHRLNQEENIIIKRNLFFNENIFELLLKKYTSKQSDSPFYLLLISTSPRKKGDIDILNEIFFNEKKADLLYSRIKTIDLIQIAKKTALKNYPQKVKQILDNPKVKESFKPFDNIKDLAESLLSVDNESEVDQLLINRIFKDDIYLEEFVNKVDDNKNQVLSIIKSLVRFEMENDKPDVLKRLYNDKSKFNKIINSINSAELISILKMMQFSYNKRVINIVFNEQSIKDKIQSLDNVGEILESLDNLDSSYENQKRIKQILIKDDNMLEKILDKISDNKQLYDFLNIILRDETNNKKLDVVKDLFTNERNLEKILNTLSSSNLIYLIKEYNTEENQEFFFELLNNPKVISKIQTTEDLNAVIHRIDELNISNKNDYQILKIILEKKDLIDKLLIISEYNRKVFYNGLKLSRKTGLKYEKDINDDGYLVDKINSLIKKTNELGYAKKIITEIIDSPVGGGKLYLFDRGTYILERNGDYAEANIDDMILTIYRKAERKNECEQMVCDDHHPAAIKESLLKLNHSKEEVLGIEPIEFFYAMYGIEKGIMTIIIEGEQVHLYFPEHPTEDIMQNYNIIIEEMQKIEMNNEESNKFEFHIMYKGNEIDTIGIRPVFIEDLPRILEEEKIISAIKVGDFLENKSFNIDSGVNTINISK